MQTQLHQLGAQERFLQQQQAQAMTTWESLAVPQNMEAVPAQPTLPLMNLAQDVAMDERIEAEVAAMDNMVQQLRAEHQGTQP